MIDLPVCVNALTFLYSKCKNTVSYKFVNTSMLYQSMIHNCFATNKLNVSFSLVFTNMLYLIH